MSDDLEPVERDYEPEDHSRLGALVIILIFLAAFGRVVRCSVERVEPVPLPTNAHA